MSEDDLRVILARQDERLKTVTEDVKALKRAGWWIVVLVLGYVANDLLGLVNIGPLP